MAEHDKIVRQAAKVIVEIIRGHGVQHFSWHEREEVDRFAERLEPLFAAARKEAREGDFIEAARLVCFLCASGEPPVESGQGTTAGYFMHPDGMCRATAIWRALRSKPEEPAGPSDEPFSEPSDGYGS